MDALYYKFIRYTPDVGYCGMSLPVCVSKEEEKEVVCRLSL